LPSQRASSSGDVTTSSPEAQRWFNQGPMLAYGFNHDAALLAAGRPAEAEAVYREELKRNPSNGWSLRGLADSLRAQKRTREAAETEQLLAAAWVDADVQPAASRL
jgi:tetratricopeptide (TPR) repeat protein